MSEVKQALIGLGKRIADARSTAGMTRKDLAEKIGVAPSTITRYERGEFDRISTPVIKAIERAVGAHLLAPDDSSSDQEAINDLKKGYLWATGEKIRFIRMRRGMSLDALARLSGYSSENARSAMQKIEMGKVDLTLTRCIAIANALEVTPAYLAGWTHEEEETGMNEETIRNRERFGRRLTAYLQQAGIRQSELADKMDVSTATTSDWCNGKKFPTITNFRKLASVLRVPVETVFSWAVPEIEERLSGAERSPQYEDDLR